MHRRHARQSAVWLGLHCSTVLVGSEPEKIIDRGHHFSSLADRHSSGIFLEGHVAAIVQTRLDPPMSAANIQ